VKDSWPAALHSLVVLVLLGACAAHGAMLVLPDNPTAQERTFATSLTNALETTNITGLVALHYCESDEPWAADTSSST
jgi:hypothetical protein